jgi:hypothetical protein
VAAVSLTPNAAQTGHGIIDDVARRMIGQMAEAVEQPVAAGSVE